MINRSFAIALVPCAAMAGNFSVSALAGYGFPFPGHSMGENTTYDAVAGTTKNEVVYGSYADGMRLGAELGFSLSEYTSLALGFRYHKSGEVETKYEQELAANSTTTKRTMSIEGYWVSPGLIFTLPGEKVAPYMRFYGNFGFPTETVKIDVTSTSTAGVDTEREIESTGGIAYGYGGGIGVEYRLSPMMSLLLEVVSESGTWGPEEGKLTKYDRDGEDMLADMEPYEKKVKYVDSYTETEDDDPESIPKQLRTTSTHTAVAINVGLKLNF